MNLRLKAFVAFLAVTPTLVYIPVFTGTADAAPIDPKTGKTQVNQADRILLAPPGHDIRRDGASICTVGFIEREKNRVWTASHCGNHGDNVYLVSNPDDPIGQLHHPFQYTRGFDFAAIPRLPRKYTNEEIAKFYALDMAYIDIPDDVQFNAGENRLSGNSIYEPQIGDEVCGYRTAPFPDVYGKIKREMGCSYVKNFTPFTYNLTGGHSIEGDSGGPLWTPGKGYVGSLYGGSPTNTVVVKADPNLERDENLPGSEFLRFVDWDLGLTDPGELEEDPIDVNHFGSNTYEELRAEVEAEIDQTVNDLRAEVDRLTQAEANVRAEIKATEEEIRLLEANGSVDSDRLAALEMELENARNEVERLRHQRDSASKRAEEAIAARDLLEKKSAELEDSKADLNTVLAQLLQETEHAEQRIAELEAQLENSDNAADVEALRSELAEARGAAQAASDLRAKLEEAVASANGLETAKEELKKLIAERTGTIADLENQQALLEQELEESKAELEAARNANSAGDDLVENRQKLEALREEAKLLLAEREKAQREADSAETAREELTRAIDELTEENSVFAADLDNLENDNSRLSQANDELKRRLYWAAYQLERARYHHRAAEQRIAELEEQLNGVPVYSARAKEIEAELVEARAEEAAASDEVVRLTNELEELESQVEAADEAVSTESDSAREDEGSPNFGFEWFATIAAVLAVIGGLLTHLGINLTAYLPF